MKPKFRYIICAILVSWLGWSLYACGSATLSKPTLTSIPSPVASSTPVPTTTPTITPTPLMAVLLSPEGSDPALADLLYNGLNDIVVGAGLLWHERVQITVDDLTPNLKLVVAIPPDIGLARLAAAGSDTQFVAIGMSGIEPTSNLTVIGADGERPDEQGFIAGVVAAMLSADWRVGVISVSDTISGRAARTGFLNGVEYFCGLCRPAHPPFYEYPLFIELPTTATSAEWQEAANYMVDHDALTVYVYPGAGDEVTFAILAKAGINIISAGVPAEADRSSWALSLSAEPLPLVQRQVDGLLDGMIKSGGTYAVPIQFSQVNPAVFTPGKQRLAEQILSDMQAGYIDTGVDLATGESRP